MPLGSCRDFGDARFCGVVVRGPDLDLEAALLDSSSLFDFVVAPLSSSQPPGASVQPPIARAGFLQDSGGWCNQVEGAVSAWIDCESQDAQLRRASEEALRAELSWAAHLSLQAVHVPLASAGCANTARLCNSLLNSLSHTPLRVRLPLLSPALEAAVAALALAAFALALWRAVTPAERDQALIKLRLKAATA